MEAVFIFQFFAAIASYKLRGRVKKKCWCTWLAAQLPELLTAVHLWVAPGFLRWPAPRLATLAGRLISSSLCSPFQQAAGKRNLLLPFLTLNLF